MELSSFYAGLRKQIQQKCEELSYVESKSAAIGAQS